MKTDKKTVKSKTNIIVNEFCKKTASDIANFYSKDIYPLSISELKPFLKQITKEFKKIWD